MDDSAKMLLAYEDFDGRRLSFDLEICFQGGFRRHTWLTADLSSYPSTYTVILVGEGKVPRRANTTFGRFCSIYDLDLCALVQHVIRSLQGDDDADGGEPTSEAEDAEDNGLGLDEEGVWLGVQSGPSTVMQGGGGDLSGHLPELKK